PAARGASRDGAASLGPCRGGADRSSDGAASRHHQSLATRESTVSQRRLHSLRRPCEVDWRQREGRGGPQRGALSLLGTRIGPTHKPRSGGPGDRPDPPTGGALHLLFSARTKPDRLAGGAVYGPIRRYARDEVSPRECRPDLAGRRRFGAHGPIAAR